MQPYFNPGPDGETAVPAIYLGGVQRRACELAGAVADGFVSHPTNSNPRYLRETCLPALADGARSAGRDLDRIGFQTVIGTSVITGGSVDAVLAERQRQRRLLAFLYSTPAYAPTLELYGWAELGPRLRELIRHDRWDALAGVLSDEVLDTLVPVAPSTSCPRSCGTASLGWARASWCPHHRPTAATTRHSAPSWRHCGLTEAQPRRAPCQRGMGKMSSSAAMASTRARRASSFMGA